MILYRALTKEDLEELEKLEKINSTLYRSYNNLENCKNRKKTIEMYDLCYKEKNEKDILSFIFGHISGKLVSSALRSPWISLTSDYFVASKYANLDKKSLRYILCLEIDDGKIIDNIDQFEPGKIFNNNYLNLSDNQLLQYRDSGIIIPYKADPDAKRKSRNFTLANYCKKDKQYLTCYDIENNNNLLITPEKQKILEKECGKELPNIIKTELTKQKTKTYRRM